MPLIEAQNIVKRYATHIALNDVSLSLNAGSVLGLLGPNGAGKTSFLRIVNQITGPDSGSLYFEGQKLSQNHIAQIGYLPEERGLYKKMEVGEQAIYLARLKGINRKEAIKRLQSEFEKFEMMGWWRKKVEELSKGMQQKVQFIITTVHDPKLLILDEPFSGFDPINVNLIKNELLQLKAKGTTILLSTHDMESVEELCDQIALFNKSKKILDGSVKSIKNAAKLNTFVIDFVGHLLQFTTAIGAGAKLIHHEVSDDNSNKVVVQLLGGFTVNDLLVATLPVIQIKGLRESIPSIREIFTSKVQDQHG